MKLPVEVETYEQTIKRFPEAIVRVWDGETLLRQGRDGERPGILRTNVFDTEAGVRLIINREIQPQLRECIHVSMSVFDVAKLKQRHTVVPELGMDQFFAVALGEFKNVAGFSKDQHVGYAIAEMQKPQMIPHLFFPLEVLSKRGSK